MGRYVFYFENFVVFFRFKVVDINVCEFVGFVGFGWIVEYEFNFWFCEFFFN